MGFGSQRIYLGRMTEMLPVVLSAVTQPALGQVVQRVGWIACLDTREVDR